MEEIDQIIVDHAFKQGISPYADLLIAKMQGMRQRIEELEKENKYLNDGCAELEAQIKHLEKDAARYRWLRKWKGQEHEPQFTVQHEIDGALWGGDLDHSIDAAMQSAKE